MVKKKIIVIIGSTASGKTGIAVETGLKYNGEVVSADSRQVYTGMDIGTGKDLREYDIETSNGLVHIPYHLIDVANPRDQFTLADFQKQAYTAIDNILDRNKLPIIAGGTGMYAQALVDGYDLSSVKPDNDGRDILEQKDRIELFKILSKYNKKFADNLNNSDKNNKRRLVRYIEMAKIQDSDLKIDKVDKSINSKYDFLIIGLKWPREVLHSRIHKRLIERLEKEGMVEEVEDLHRDGVPWKKLEAFGLEYRFISRYLQDMLTYDEMVDELHRAIKKFAKQQKKWYKRWEKQGTKINWFEGETDELWKLIDSFLEKK
jgi:tRNA dimethylallyltransferase